MRLRATPPTTPVSSPPPDSLRFAFPPSAGGRLHNGPLRETSALGSASLRPPPSSSEQRRVEATAARCRSQVADSGATSAREDSDSRSGYEPDRPLKRNVLAARSGDRRRQRDAVASTERLGFWWVAEHARAGPCSWRGSTSDSAQKHAGIAGHSHHSLVTCAATARHSPFRRAQMSVYRPEPERPSDWVNVVRAWMIATSPMMRTTTSCAAR